MAALMFAPVAGFGVVLDPRPEHNMRAAEIMTLAIHAGR
jgi:hypothetical protein